MFEVVGQDIISGNMGFIGTDPDRLYRMGGGSRENGRCHRHWKSGRAG